MLQELEAVFAGTALQLEDPLNLAAGKRVRIVFESVLPNEVKPSKSFFKMAQSLKLQGEQDWSEKITGSFEDEPAFEEVLALGRAIRKGLNINLTAERLKPLETKSFML